MDIYVVTKDLDKEELSKLMDSRINADLFMISDIQPSVDDVNKVEVRLTKVDVKVESNSNPKHWGGLIQYTDSSDEDKKRAEENFDATMDALK